MAITKTAKKEENVEKETVEKAQYFYAVGRRKTAVAKVKLFLSKDNQNSLTVNGKKSSVYFPIERLEEMSREPFALIGEGVKFDADVKASGGGVSAQAEAVRLGIARALVVFNEEYKKSLKAKGFLTRDSREVERKKPGLKKARRAPQWAKR